MSVPRRLGAGGLESFDGGSTLAMQPRHPAGFPSKDDSDSSSNGSKLSSPHSHTYTEQLSSSSSTHIATTGLQSLSIQQHHSSSSPSCSPNPRHHHPSSPHLSTASTVTTPHHSDSPSSTFSLCSPGSDVSYGSPTPRYFPHPSPFPQPSPFAQPSPTTAPGPTTTTYVSTFSSSSSTSSSPIASPLLARRNASRPHPSNSQSPAVPSSPSLRFPSPFKSLKNGSSCSSLLSSSTSSSVHLSTPVVNETINSIMQEDTTAPSSSIPSKSPGSPRPLYSPKPSPGVRPNVASPAPSSASASASVSYTTLPAIDRVHRYVVTGTLQQSLFGVVKLAFDRVLKQQVAIKISRRERAQQQQTRSGVSVLENVKREAAVMQYLHERSAAGHLHRTPLAHRKSLYTEMFAHMTVNEILNNVRPSPSFPPSSSSNGAAVNGKKAKRMSSRATTHTRVNDERMMDDDAAHSIPITALQVPESEGECDSDMRTGAATPFSSRYSLLTSVTSPTSSSAQVSPMDGGGVDASDLEGERYICKYVEELEDEHFHYLVTEFVPAGDLYSMLTSFPQHRLSEVQARGLFRQMVLGVKYLHTRNVAHLDMSLENMCLDMDDAVRIIDFGVAALHPFTPTAYQTSYFSFPSASSPISFPSSGNHQSSSSPNSQTPRPPTSSSLSSPCVPFPHRSFLCKPVKELYSKPGKIRYMSPELFQAVAWDAFANDVFSLGVILYSLLTGRPPFQQAESIDVWFHVIYSGQWLTPQIRKQPSAHVYTHLSDAALSLINLILKPQEVRPTCEQILQHPWMQME